MLNRLRQGLLGSALTTTALVLSVAGPASAELMRTVWYGPGYHGNLTANGETFSRWGHTAAHPTWPFGTQVRVTNPENGRSLVVRINDRSGGLLDVSEQVATELGFKSQGVANMNVDVIKWGGR